MVLGSVSARGHTDSVATLTLNDRILASGGDDGNVYFWSLDQSSFPVQHIPRRSPCSAVKFDLDKSDVNEDEVNCIDVLKGESRLAAADDSGAVQIFDTSSGEVVRTLKKHDNICSVAKFRPMRSWQLISGGLDCRVIVSDWKGTGRSVIIFELDEIINSDLFEDPQPVPTHSNEFANRASSESQASTSEYAEVEFDEFVETDEEPDDPDEGELATSHPLPSGHADSLSVPSRGGDSASGDPHVSEFERGHSDTNISELLNWQLSEQPDSSDTAPTSIAAQDAWISGLPINPPMVHSLACSASGDFVAAGLEKSTIELFSGDGKRLSHKESLYGHRRAVSALHFIGDSHLISGGNDYRLFVWTLGVDMDGRELLHGQG
ncbi:WD repeat-containing protein 53 [Clonorchis sinensis]|uniref:WD repeat-containing protein 53 n=1 Tax=Clonorchis sinensis TaxID=79923 RepID=A0A419PLQ9_CLOSI|nr:WD repeat-containing protein 53 [Clonorchis sinensis]